MKKNLALILALVLLTPLFSACAEDAGSAPLPAGIDWSVHETFTWWVNASTNDYYTSYNENPVVSYLEEKFNVTFAYEEPVAGSEVQSLSLMFGSGLYKDAVAMNQYQGSWDDLIEDGVVLDIAQYLEYMPNLSARMEADPGYRASKYNDDGQILSLNSYPEEGVKPWCGLVYRRDILEEMTDGNVQFPSGKDEPGTIADWDYMLPLFKAYFEQQGLVEYAPLIIPFNGFFPDAELTDAFGVYPVNFYVDGAQVFFGPSQDGWRAYLTKMNEWYEAGYIYQDFASRTQDMYYQPNSSLVYGNAAGIWMGMTNQLGDVMSEPGSDVVYDVRPLQNPLGEGLTYADQFVRGGTPSQGAGLGFMITTSCKNPEKLLSIIDYMYSDEGGLLTKYGLTNEQIPASDIIYAANGLSDGAYWFDEAGNFVYNPLMDAAGGKLHSIYFAGEKLPGYIRNSYETLAASGIIKNAYAKWTAANDFTIKMPMPGVTLTEEEQAATVGSLSGITMDLFLIQMEYTPAFIVGTRSLDDEGWGNYIKRLEDAGLALMLETNQAAYDRYLAR